ncbi:MAG: PhoX family phosphatase, partial [Methyloceanibacter sp.]|nr:PhoX family phosphatase [Methyloceanibacter sp.]
AEEAPQTDPKTFVPKGFSFKEVEAGVDRTHHAPEGYDTQYLLRWGDPIVQDAPAFDPYRQTPGAQNRQFGYNNDYVAYFPMDRDGKFIEGEQTDVGNERGLLCVNHEYALSTMMFPGVEHKDGEVDFATIADWMVDVEMSAVGVTVVEIEKHRDVWRVVEDSPYNRRITANTPMTVDGPVTDKGSKEGLERLKTSYDKSGEALLGTLANCAGGRTPWGTYLTAEENIHFAFYTDETDLDGEPALSSQHDARRESFEAYSIPVQGYVWGRNYTRFNLDKEPNEPNRFGWIVEIDPFDPRPKPVKHTALGRFFHEGAETFLSDDGRAVVFSGDDSKFEYVYRFVSDGKYEPGNKKANMSLLSKGTLSVAKFNDDGTGEWIPLQYGKGELAEASAAGKFKNQADVVIDARLAADEVGATKMDRPEDIQPNIKNKRVYVMLTNNTSRSPDHPGVAANPRANNKFGHIIEITPDGLDFAADRFKWKILVLCGDPNRPSLKANWNPETSANGWFVTPDNAAVDDQGRLWVATDQGSKWPRTMRADGLYALETDSVGGPTPHLFFRVPVGAELCGPCFTPNGETLFVAVQHPGTDGVRAFHGTDGDLEEEAPAAGEGDFDPNKPVSFNNPATRWPDFKDDVPPRPSVVVITKQGGGKIGG